MGEAGERARGAGSVREAAQTGTGGPGARHRSQQSRDVKRMSCSEPTHQPAKREKKLFNMNDIGLSVCVCVCVCQELNNNS